MEAKSKGSKRKVRSSADPDKPEAIGLHEKLLNLPHVKASLLEHAGVPLEASEEFVDWVIRKCFRIGVKRIFASEAGDIFEEFSRFSADPTEENAQNLLQSITNKTATTAAAFYMLGAVAGVAAMLPDDADERTMRRKPSPSATIQ
jgi:hypothetical protein